MSTRKLLYNNFVDVEKIKSKQKIIKNLLIIKILLKKTKKIFKKKNYNLGKKGRMDINKKIYKKIFWDNSNFLKPEDILGSLYQLIELNKI